MKNIIEKIYSSNVTLKNLMDKIYFNNLMKNINSSCMNSKNFILTQRANNFQEMWSI
jgi:hypothetical protein